MIISRATICEGINQSKRVLKFAPILLPSGRGVKVIMGLIEPSHTFAKWW
jgi:hypothetical protein